MDTGTAKPPASLLAVVPHHLVDILEPSQGFSAADFVRLADEAVQQISSRGAVPLVVGGAMFYARTLMYGLPETPPSDPDVRQALIAWVERDGLPAVYAELAAVDAETAGRLHINDRSRILRAMEVYWITGRPLSTFRPSPRAAGRDAVLFAVRRSRSDLNGRIDARVDQMMANGLADEVARLAASGFGAVAPGMASIGYAEFFDEDGRLRGREAHSAATALIKRNSYRFAKRQMTFARRLPVDTWLDLPSDKGAGDAVASIAAAAADVARSLQSGEPNP